MLNIKIGRSINDQRNKKIEDKVSKFVSLKTEQKEINDQLKEIQSDLGAFGKTELNDSDAASITLIVGDDAVNIKYDWDVKVKDDEKLKKVLGDRYQDLVSIKTEIKPVAKLKEMALEDDGLKLCLDVKEKAPAFKVA